MLVLLLKSSACLAVFLTFYKLLLENERMHTFKRFYLLAALIIALVIPSITFTEYIEVAPIQNYPEILELKTTAPLVIEETSNFAWPVLLWSIYAAGVLFFSLRFLKNLLKIARNIRNNPKVRIDPLVSVLLQKAVIPHTFFQFVFLNRKKFEANEIPNEVWLHEAAHAEQKHSFDILFVELMQIVFWFNPLIYFAKKFIKLNHEFLADQAVLNSGTATPQYQNILLDFASSANDQDNQSILANAINYSSTRLTLFGKTFTFGSTTVGQVKKRFTIMKTRTSKKSIVLRSFTILPLLFLLVLGFSETKQVEVIKETPNFQTGNQSMEYFNIRIDPNGKLLIKNQLIELGDLSTYLSNFNSSFTQEQRAKKVKVVIMADENCPKAILDDIETVFKEYGVAQINIVGPENSLLSEPFKHQGGARNSEVSKYNRLAKKYNAQPKEKRVIPSEDLKSLEDIYRKMSEKQKTEAQPFPECPDPKASNQKGASKVQVKAYNALSKKYNAMLAEKGNIFIKKSDVDRLEYLHGIMNEVQRANAEPFPDFPEPPEPPAPPSPEDPGAREFAAKRIQEIIATQDPHDGNALSLRPYSYPRKINFIEEYTEYPKQETYFSLEDEDATIYLDGKEISYLEMMRKQKEGEITTINISKNANGQKIIRITGMNDLTNAANLQNQDTKAISLNYKYESERSNSSATGAFKEPTSTSLENEVQETIPPPPPPYKVPEPRKNYSKELLKAYDDFDKEGDTYGNTVAKYIKSKKGKVSDLRVMYEKVMVLYNNYMALAVEEGLMPPPIKKLTSKKITDKNAPPPPPPPAPVPPITHIKEMAKKDAQFYYNGKEISSDKAIELLEKNKEINIDSRSEKGKRPVIKLSTRPIKIGDASNMQNENYIRGNSRYVLLDQKSTPKSPVKKVEMVSLISNLGLERKKIGERFQYFLNNYSNCSNYSFEERPISEREALDIYLNNTKIKINSNTNKNNGITIKC